MGIMVKRWLFPSLWEFYFCAKWLVYACMVTYVVNHYHAYVENVNDAKSAAHVAILLTDMMKWEAVVKHVATSTRLVSIYSVCVYACTKQRCMYTLNVWHMGA